MSAFDLPMACARNMLECMSQNHFETPPYGPLPDASRKLTTAIQNMIDALVIAMDAESQGFPMPPIPTIPEPEVESFKSMLRPEHTLHRDHAEALTHLVDAREELTHAPAGQQPWQQGQSDEERQRQERERSRQEQELQRQTHEQADRERQDRERHARESAEHERQFVAQSPPQQPLRPGEAPRHTGDPGRG